MSGYLVEVRCPTCAGSTDAAIMLKVPATLSWALVRSSEATPLDVIHAVDRCGTCGRNWAVKVLRAA